MAVYIPKTVLVVYQFKCNLRRNYVLLLLRFNYNSAYDVFGGGLRSLSAFMIIFACTKLNLRMSWEYFSRHKFRRNCTCEPFNEFE